jgi:hemerythrin-like metal-binding protein
MVFKWSPRYITGIPKIDAQHQELVRIINDVFEILSERNSEGIDSALAQLEVYVTHHLSLEEAYMTETEYPDRENHCAAHREFAARIKELRNGAEDRKVVALKVGILLDDWRKDHLLTEDQRLFEHVRRVG